jgi:hypothetical protein
LWALFVFLNLGYYLKQRNFENAFTLYF